MKFGFEFADAAMPRTVFYEKFCQALCANSRFSADPAAADVLFPVEDTAMETNWPRYADPDSAFRRGSVDWPRHLAYLQQLFRTGRRLCILNMVPTIAVAISAAPHDQIAVADSNLRVWDRASNPRTVSMPALPLIVGTVPAPPKTITASFRGINSHPSRRTLAGLHNGTTVIVDLVAKDNHYGKIDAERGIVDRTYADLLAASVFAFVPRGDAEFSYRLLEVMSFGCIPIIISDGLVLPFDRTVHWSHFSAHIPEQMIDRIPELLKAIPPKRIQEMQREVASTYARYFSGLPTIVGTLLDELETIFSLAFAVNTTGARPGR